MKFKTVLKENVLKEPLLHFLLLGALIFVLSGQFSGSVLQAKQDLILSTEQQAALNARFQQLWSRPPDAKEKQHLMDEFLREEVAVREAQRLGLDNNDAIIRRRLRQKLEFLVSDNNAVSEQALQNYYRQHLQFYQSEPRYSFRQIYFAHALPTAKSEALLQQLHTDDSGWEQQGERSLMEKHFIGRSGNELVRQFGEAFVQRLAKAETGHWFGPVVSGVGTHLVYLESRQVPVQLGFAEAKAQVKKDYLQFQYKQKLDNYYQQLLAQYHIVIEKF